MRSQNECEIIDILILTLKALDKVFFKKIFEFACIEWNKIKINDWNDVTNDEISNSFSENEFQTKNWKFSTQIAFENFLKKRAKELNN